MESEYGFKLTQKAEADLDDIVSYLAVDLANPQAASNFVDKLQGAINEACSFPESGAPVVNEFLPETKVRKKLVGNYVLYYLPEREEQIIYVLRIVYGRRNLDEILRQMDL